MNFRDAKIIFNEEFQDWSYSDNPECAYPTKQELFMYEDMKLCGCGYPEASYNFILNFLKEHLPTEDRFTKEGTKRIYQLVENDLEIVVEVLQKLLTNLGLLEHGGNVGGSWPTDMAKDIIDAGYYEEREDD